MTVPEELVLAGDFPAAHHDQWRALVGRVVRRAGLSTDESADPESVLASRTYDGITIDPLYTATNEPDFPLGVPGLAPYVRGSRPAGQVDGGWDVRQRHARPDPRAANQEILADLEHGVSSVWLVVDPAGRRGLKPADLAVALGEVYLEFAPIVLEGGEHAVEAAEALLALYTEKGAPKAAVRGNLGFDPLAVQARSGRVVELAPAVELAVRTASVFSGLRCFTADALPYHDAGASDAEEIGCSIATALHYVRALTDAGMLMSAAFGTIEFRYAATADQFATIAKLRAARRLWARVAQVCGAAGEQAAQQQHVVTSSAMMAKRDAWVNLLRTTVACLAAGIGGAESVTVQPFDAAIGAPAGFARRIARNTQALLIEESHLARVIDPAGGSWYVDSRTDQLAYKAWQWFQEIEAAGGMAAALDTGLVSDRIAKTRAKRQRDIGDRSVPIVGVSEFPDPAESVPTRESVESGEEGGLPVFRYASPYEDFRAASDEFHRRTGDRPRVFLATMGPVAAHTFSATFARNLLAAGGIQAAEAGPLDNVDSATEAFAASGARIACVCGPDELSGEDADTFVQALKSAGASRVLIVGKPGEVAADAFLHEGCDALDLLGNLHEALGVRS